MRSNLGFALALAFSVTVISSADGQEAATDSSEDTAKIGEAVESYVAAFNARDVERLSGHWTTDGVYTSRTTGLRVNGRESISEQFSEALGTEETPAKLAVETQSIEFVSPRVALERGQAWVTRGPDDVTQTRYTAIYVKEGDKWLIDRITEDEVVVQESHYENLKPLEWMVGDWVDAGEGFTIEIQCDWTTKQNYISRKFSVSSDEGVDASGLQVIGWDPREKTIRSWLFDSDGGFVSGTWTQRADQWVVQSVATLADGTSGSFTSIFKPQDDGSYLWQKVNRVIDGKLLPNLEEITVQRK